MKRRVGMPRAMGYYYLFPFFRALLQELGAEVVVSPVSTRATLDNMDVCPTDEPCLAVKLHFSHADALAQRADIDHILLPIVARIHNSVCCPKFIGIADMIRHGLGLLPERVLSPTIEYSENPHQMLAALQPMAERLGVRDKSTLRRAIQAGVTAMQEWRALCVTHQLTTVEGYHALEKGGLPEIPAVSGPTIAVIGHPYILYEPVSQDIVKRLRVHGRVVTAEMVAPADIYREIESVEEGSRLWRYEAELLGAALHLLRNRIVDKIILVGSFECGPESIIESYLEEAAQQHGVPLMVLALDEHSGEAGLATRLEAFLDTEKSEAVATLPEPPPLHIPRAEMVVGFPSMGQVDIAIRSIVESFGLRTVPTPRTTAECVRLGRELAPEFVCFPFTATLGQMRYMLERGANTLIMVGGKGACRLGWYAQVQERLLRNFGYKFQLYVVDSPFPLREKWGKFHDMLRGLAGDASWGEILRVMRMGYHQLTALDRADEAIRRLRAFEAEQGTANILLRQYLQQLAITREVKALRRLERDFMAEVAAVKTEETNPLQVQIIGEIWVALEQSATREVERWLGARRAPRVWVQRSLTVSSWFQSNVLHIPSALRKEQALSDAARPWLAQKVGGHGVQTVGSVVAAHANGTDGVLHIFPFTCMPEIIAQNIIVPLTEKLDIPVLTYIVSEQMGEAGMETRLESFLDLLEERRLVRT